MVIHKTEEPEFRFTGFSAPRYTQVPDELFDILLPRLAGSELKVLLYIIRRTFGFKKDYDDISLNQLVHGITTSDGRVLDQGTGLKRDTVITALKSLTEMNIILKKKNQSQEKGFEANTYALNIVGLDLEEINPSPKNPIRASPKNPTSPSPKNPTSPNPKNPTSPSRKNGTYNKQVNNKTVLQDTEATTIESTSDGQEDVVVALSFRGLSKRVAKKLIVEHGIEYCLEKIGYFDFVSGHDPESIKKNPAGWLRRAIEDNYVEPRNFVSRSESERLEQEQLAVEIEYAKQAERETQRIAEEKAQKDATEQAYRDSLFLQYGTTQEDFALWNVALQEFEYAFVDNKMSLDGLSRANILQIRDGIVLIGFREEHIKRHLSHPSTMKKIEKTLSQLVGNQIQVQYELVPEPALISDII